MASTGTNYMYVEEEKITMQCGMMVRFWVHKEYARKMFHKQHILFRVGLDLVNWEAVYQVLHGVPRMLQVWASKQVMGTAGTFGSCAKLDKNVNPICPSCLDKEET